jgi:nucleotide-binding universal stress UspA family protein
MYQRILVPLDGSTLAEQALPHAAALCRALSAELFIARVSVTASELLGHAGADIAYTEQVAKHSREVAMEYLEEVTAYWNQCGVRVHAQPLAGPVAEAIVDFAQQNAIDLIVMSTHGRTGGSRWMYGSVAERVLRGAHCPVLIVRSQVKE